MSKTITGAKIYRSEETGRATVMATFTDDNTLQLFEYYMDELSFNERDFIGLTESQARALRHARDVEYLQS